MSEHPHVYVATPAYDGKVDSDYSQSLGNACWHAGLFGIQVTAAVMGNSAFIDLGRNIFVRMFLDDEEFTHLFFIDSDLKFPSEAFIGLVQNCTEDRPVVSGVYRRRQEPEDYPAKWAPEPEISEEKGVDCLWVEDGFLKCDRVPTGFLCIHRSVVEKMAEKAEKVHVKGQPPLPRLFYTKLDDANRFVGEDFCWCDDYIKQFDRKIDVWPDFDFVHAGYEGNYAKWLNVQAEEYAEGEKKPKRRLGKRRHKDVA